MTREFWCYFWKDFIGKMFSNGIINLYIMVVFIFITMIICCGCGKQQYYQAEPIDLDSQLASVEYGDSLFVDLDERVSGTFCVRFSVAADRNNTEVTEAEVLYYHLWSIDYIRDEVKEKTLYDSLILFKKRNPAMFVSLDIKPIYIKLIPVDKNYVKQSVIRHVESIRGLKPGQYTTTFRVGRSKKYGD